LTDLITFRSIRFFSCFRKTVFPGTACHGRRRFDFAKWFKRFPL